MIIPRVFAMTDLDIRDFSSLEEGAYGCFASSNI